MQVSPDVEAETIVQFWRQAGRQRWFTHDAAFDAEIAARFGAVQAQASDGQLGAWEDTADGALALLLLLDQFPRNMFRGTPRMFATDPLARKIAASAIAHGFDRSVDPTLRTFFYLPLMHSEALTDQERCVALYEAAGDADSLAYANAHRAIIARFGRFPHRNPVLGRAMTADEQRFLDEGGFKG